ncbi:hypothetical protein L3X38_045501 [Prunus dulcis]|uniref:Serine/threonine-protein phosphatase n=1 Tax=Prunus dulcis TaxID=3755 RepID=A0AAD4YJ31_PRUDU|nr:hypothetical protein L3X38_045501 [Prunus dulcis]
MASVSEKRRLHQARSTNLAGTQSPTTQPQPTSGARFAPTQPTGGAHPAPTQSQPTSGAQTTSRGHLPPTQTPSSSGTVPPPPPPPMRASCRHRDSREQPLPGKGVRGACRGITTSNIVQTIQEKITIVFHPVSCKPMNKETSSLLSHDLGAIIRKKCPMNYAYWGDIPKDKRNELMDEITLNYDIDLKNVDCGNYVNKIMARRFRDFKHELHKHFKFFPSAEEALANPPLEIVERDATHEWLVLCTHFQSPNFLKASRANEVNQAKKKIEHLVPPADARVERASVAAQSTFASQSSSASPSCNPPLPASQDQQSAATPIEVAEATIPHVFNSSPITTNSKYEDNTSSQSPPLEIPIGWPRDGKLTLNWVRNLMSVFDWASRNLEPIQLPNVFPIEVFDSLVLCASKILHKEANCVTVDDLGLESRVVIVGDLHGQLHDLLFLLHDAGFPSENQFFVFNGDYVDRGAWGFESFLILLAWKAFMPKRVYLLRGNHESKYCTSVYGFENEVLTKYSDGGKHVYRKCLGCFEDLPLASIIGKHVYTAHGGLFRHMPAVPKKSKRKKNRRIAFNPEPNSLSLGSIEDLNKARRSVLDPPYEGSNLIPGDVMWSDPSMSPGLSPNTERGIGLLWGPDCTESFLKTFQLKLIIRSHEGPDAREKRPGLGGMDEGYTIDHIVESGKLITLFSAPDYPQFQGTEERYRNKGAYIILEPPNFDDPVFRSFEAITPRPKANAFYNFEEVIDSDEELDLASMVTSP